MKKPGLLFIFFGLGERAWYKLPFIKKSIFGASLPCVLSGYIKRAVKYVRGKCSCGNPGSYRSCSYIKIFNHTIGLCKNCRAENKNNSKLEETLIVRTRIIENET